MVDEPPNWKPTCWKLELWPAHDQAAWVTALTPGDPFDDPIYGSQLRAASVEAVRRGYGRWLDFLDSRNWLDHHESPLGRVTRGRLRAYFKSLKACGNEDSTIIGRFSQLTMAMKMMAPGADVSWICRPMGRTIYASLPKTRNAVLVPDSGVLLRWATTMMDQADITSFSGMQAFRDGLLLAMLTCRGRRLRAMAGLRLGHEVTRHETVYVIKLGAELVKTNKVDRFALPASLTSYIEKYADIVRPGLLDGLASDFFWINHKGNRWTAKGIQHRVFNLTRARFGIAFGPHRFRHAIATTSALRDPNWPTLGADVLGISSQIVEQHYDRAGQVVAATELDSIIEARRRKLIDKHTEF